MGTEDSAMTTWFPLIDGNDEVKIASAQQKDKDSLYNTYKEMIQIRKDNPALFYGNKNNKNKLYSWVDCFY